MRAYSPLLWKQGSVNFSELPGNPKVLTTVWLPKGRNKSGEWSMVK